MVCGEAVGEFADNEDMVVDRSGIYILLGDTRQRANQMNENIKQRRRETEQKPRGKIQQAERNVVDISGSSAVCVNPGYRIGVSKMD